MYSATIFHLQTESTARKRFEKEPYTGFREVSE